jgi:molecular chaperone GrpE
VTDRPPSDDPDRVVIRDKRRIDPVTGAPRHPDPDPAADRATSVAPPLPGLARTEEELAERTADLQRLQAEFANYRKRVDRDRMAVGELATGRLLADLVPVLDDIDRAREHGDLTGAFKAVADQLEAILAKHGLVAFGDVGDRFDPALHEAVLHAESDEVDAPTATMVMRRGYQHRDRLLRPAMVGVTDPAAPSAPVKASGSPDTVTESDG